jgi:hypothetical protein
MNERRTVPRHKVVLPALCRSRTRPDFYAVTDDLSADGIRFRSATVPPLDEDLVCSVRHVGQFEARVVRREAGRFVVRVLDRPLPVAEVARRLLSEAEEQSRGAEPIRVHPRIVPRQRAVAVVVADGRVLPGRLLNVSASGVGLALTEPVAVGVGLTIGRTRATVMRVFPDGVGAAFVVPFDPAAVDESIVL